MVVGVQHSALSSTRAGTSHFTTAQFVWGHITSLTRHKPGSSVCGRACHRDRLVRCLFVMLSHCSSRRQVWVMSKNRFVCVVMLSVLSRQCLHIPSYGRSTCLGHHALPIGIGQYVFRCLYLCLSWSIRRAESSAAERCADEARARLIKCIAKARMFRHALTEPHMFFACFMVFQ